MVGLGEDRNEVLQVMDDLRAAAVDFLTIGQYLQPSRKHHPVVRFVPPDEFQGAGNGRLCQGFYDGVGEPADALLASCRRGLCAAESATNGTLTNAPVFQQAAGAALRADIFDLVADVEHYPESCHCAARSSTQAHA